MQKTSIERHMLAIHWEYYLPYICFFDQLCHGSSLYSTKFIINNISDGGSNSIIAPTSQSVAAAVSCSCTVESVRTVSPCIPRKWKHSVSIARIAHGPLKLRTVHLSDNTIIYESKVYVQNIFP
jgi:hypothetical protein